MSEETVSGPGTGTEAQIVQEKLRKLHQRRSLFNHPATTHLHQPRNINVVFEAEKAAGNFNKKVAVGLTSVFQAMPTFWLIMAWIVLWIASNATIAHFDPLPWPLLLCLASVPQLPLMIVIMVGQGLLGRKQELQSEEQFNTTIKTYHDIELIMAHLAVQDEELLRQTHMIIHLMKATGVAVEDFMEEREKLLATTPEASGNTALPANNGHEALSF